MKKKEVFLNVVPFEDGIIRCCQKARILSKKQFLELYSNISGIIHEKNPFIEVMSEKKRKDLYKQIVEARDEVVTLLNRHKILGIKIRMIDISKDNHYLYGPRWK